VADVDSDLGTGGGGGGGDDSLVLPLVIVGVGVLAAICACCIICAFARPKAEYCTVEELEAAQTTFNRDVKLRECPDDEEKYWKFADDLDRKWTPVSVSDPRKIEHRQ
jgi:hypothetical protein